MLKDQLAAAKAENERLLAEVERLRSLIWPGPAGPEKKWEPTPEQPQQDFYEAVMESLCDDRRELNRVRKCIAEIDFAKCSPFPWTASEAVEWRAKQKSPFDDHGAYIYAADGSIVVEGGQQDEQGGAVGVLANADVSAIVKLSELTVILKETE